MVLEPLFYVVALLSVFVHGMGKAGFGMGLPILAIPMMSLFHLTNTSIINIGNSFNIHGFNYDP